MKEVSIIGVDLAKQVFRLHGATAEGEVVFRKKLSRKQFLAFMQTHPGCRVAMEACATAHHWARTLMAFGHDVRLIAPKFVKPYVKNQKNDMADAEAIAEAASRPTMRFVEVKTPEQQGLGVIFRLRDLLVGQRTQTVNALRGHLAEFGVVTAKGRENVDKLRSALDRDEEAADIPATVRHMAQLFFDQINDLSRRIADLDAQIAAASKRSRFSARLQKNARHWPHHFNGLGGFRSTDGNVPAGARLLGLAGPCAPAAFERWKAKARADEQIRAAGYPAFADHRRDGGDFRRQGATACRELLACTYSRPQTEDAGRLRPD